MKRSDIVVSLTKIAPTNGITQVIPQHSIDFKKCEININIGLFFDGTNNNRENDFPKLAHSNIARLYRAYRQDNLMGYIPIYIPGVGTRFKEIGEDGESTLGGTSAFGCEGRVIFGLLSIFNALNFCSFKNNIFDEKTILALCRNSIDSADNEDREILSKFGTRDGLLQTRFANDSIRVKFLKKQATFLAEKLKEGKPRAVECFLDVFGFSRGAAEARVFCHWLDELLVDGRLAGVSIRFRFVGIIDTVASAGFWSGAVAIAKNSTGGHGAWASAKALQLPVSVQNCVHMVAIHELRRNFPLDEIGVNGKLQSGWIQHAYPGAHSDVGGGYRPNELGISLGSDSLKLSQIPLNHMLDCAIAAGAPMKRPVPSPGGYDPFAIHPDLAKAYDSFISQATLAPRPIYEWLQQYLNWRWQIRDHFHTSNQVKGATQEEREVLIAFNNRMIADAAAMTRSAKMNLGQRTFSILKGNLLTGARRDLVTTTLLEPEAREVLALAQRAKPTPLPFAELFDKYVHDSLAGFNHPSLELTGYWRYRRVFLGNDDHTIASNQEVETTRNTA
ncbi:DUF2235 domain-containing protein [Massilia forsythiae]|uniref:DUF2235 domain-containing protein n=1 Tax=Massilia forsythiae TaxID=2728020 RepID=A0A7Z2ZSR1_9BURK|nr:DUF2235 domain-containing protein [Massilia forsythiae]QJE00763.1 DUF2235 domain-containing protein [Massilia forsythiae]